MQATQAKQDDEIVAIIKSRTLDVLFLPILDFRARAYCAFEALIRGRDKSLLRDPSALFAAAERHGLRRELEAVAREMQFTAFANLRLPGKLFINASLESLDDEAFRNGSLDLLRRLGLNPARIVLEITENQRIADFPSIQQTLAHLRSLGYQIAIDDLGEGFANLRMWSEVKPEYVKVDRHFIDGIADDTLKFRFVKTMQDLASTCSARVIAEGIERERDCLALRDLGIDWGQGLLIARPQITPVPLVSDEMSALLSQREIMVVPNAPIYGNSATVRSLARNIAPVTPETLNDVVFRRFEEEPDLISLPIVANEVPLGSINRYNLIDRFARPFRRELYGRRACTQFMDAEPLIIDEGTPVQEAGLLISRSAHRHLANGFLITEKGKYLGVGSGHDLMAMITEMQIQSARYANPLTQLPGNVPINEHIDRLLQRGATFTACYFDLDHFKPFNDTYGYRKGDDVIQIVGKIISETSDPHLDFVGHIGGDDFIALYQSDDWEARCARMLRLFDERISAIVLPEHLQRGGYSGENRRGEAVFHPLPSLSIGALPVLAGQYDSPPEISAAVAQAKKQAKKIAGSSLFIERRRRPATPRALHRGRADERVAEGN